MKFGRSSKSARTNQELICTTVTTHVTHYRETNLTN